MTRGAGPVPTGTGAPPDGAGAIGAIGADGAGTDRRVVPACSTGAAAGTGTAAGTCPTGAVSA
ncbi:hypothetical protein PJN93_32665, partial [Mycobacterium kansasii]